MPPAKLLLCLLGTLSASVWADQALPFEQLPVADTVPCVEGSANDNLYQALGGVPGITRIVEGMLLNAARDPRIQRHFRNIAPDRLRSKLIEQLYADTGGPCIYTGDTLAEAHKGLNLQPLEFNALVEDLIASMNSERVPTSVQCRILAGMKAQQGEVLGK